MWMLNRGQPGGVGEMDLFRRKMLVDRAFCEGLNRVTYHGYSHSPLEEGYPGRSYHAGVDMNPKVVWWSKARPFMDYLGQVLPHASAGIICGGCCILLWRPGTELLAYVS